MIAKNTAPFSTGTGPSRATNAGKQLLDDAEQLAVGGAHRLAFAAADHAAAGAEVQAVEPSATATSDTSAPPMRICIIAPHTRGRRPTEHSPTMTKVADEFVGRSGEV